MFIKVNNSRIDNTTSYLFGIILIKLYTQSTPASIPSVLHPLQRVGGILFYCLFYNLQKKIYIQSVQSLTMNCCRNIQRLNHKIGSTSQEPTPQHPWHFK